jgi:hypothetical protein
MIELIGSLQQAALGAVLLWAGLFKTAGRGSAEAANASALPLLLRRQTLAAPVYRAVGGLEIAVALLLLLPPAPAAELAAAAVLTAGFLGYLGYSRRIAPHLPCGCMGAGRAPVSRRALLRAALLCAASVLGLAAGLAGGGFWAAELAARPLPAVAVLTLEGLAVAALSPELQWGRLRRAVWVLRAGRGGPGCGADELPVEASVRQVEASEPYQRLAGLLTGGVQTHWQDGCWRFLSYPASYDAAPAVAVFAVPVVGAPAWVRAIITDAAKDVVLLEAPPEPLAAAGSHPHG